MRSLLLALVPVLGLGLAVPTITHAQTPGAEPRATTRPSRAARPKREPTAGRREPTAGQLAARERQKKCGVEWREAKTKGETGGLKWPQYWSKCNARLKGGTA